MADAEGFTYRDPTPADHPLDVDPPSETTPLTANARPTSSHQDVFRWRDFFFDTRQTPGRESSRLPIRWAAGICHTFKVARPRSYSSSLLIIVPFGLQAGALSWSPVLVFILNYLAIFSLSQHFAFTLGEFSESIGSPGSGKLLVAMFDNPVELIIGIAALVNDQADMVRSYLLGSLVANVLLVIGLGLFLGNLFNFDEQGNRIEQALPTHCLGDTIQMTALTFIMLFPAMTWSLLSFRQPLEEDKEATIISLSLSFIALGVYMLSLWFKFRSHRQIYEHLNFGPVMEPQLGQGTAFITLLLLGSLVWLCAGYTMSAYKHLVQQKSIPRHALNFVGFPLLRVLGADHILAIRCAIRNRLDLSLDLTIASVMNILLFVMPVLATLGWWRGVAILLFKQYEAITGALSTAIFTLMVLDNKSNYLKGFILLFFYYLIILLCIYDDMM